MKERVAHKIYHRYRARALRKRIPWHLTWTDVYDIIYKPCYYCGTKGNNKYKIKWGEGAEFKHIRYRGIDRKSSKRGYTKANVVPACGTCNYAKLEMTVGQFKTWVKAVYERMYKVGDG